MMFFGKREGTGMPLGRTEEWSHWDTYFHGHSEMYDWKVDGHVVTAMGRETNDFYRLLDWTPAPYRMTWWLGRDGRITGALVQAIPQRAASRMEEFREWAKQHEPAELEHVMPGGRIDPTGDRPERFAALLRKWRATASR